MRAPSLLLAGVLSSLAMTGCVPPLAMFGNDVVSLGAPHRGRLHAPYAIADRGEGFTLFRTRAAGGYTFGTERLVALVTRAARYVAHRVAGTAPLRVGDLSVYRGGSVPRHHSHRNGRDVDLIFYALDATNRPVEAQAFVPYDAQGNPVDLTAGVRFDPVRNWYLVEYLVRDRQAGVVRIFCAAWIKTLLLEQAKQLGRDSLVIARADELLRQPGDSAPHDDHFHVRVACQPHERLAGCVDGGPMPTWMLRDWEKTDSNPADDETVVTELLDDPPPPSVQTSTATTSHSRHHHH